jgi:hypothetical protein
MEFNYTTMTKAFLAVVINVSDSGKNNFNWLYIWLKELLRGF